MNHRSRNRRNFVIGQGAQGTRYHQSKLSYRRNLEKSLVIALFAAIIFVHLAPDIEISKPAKPARDVILDMIDIPEVPPEPEQPKMKMEKVVAVERPEPPPAEDPNTRLIEEILQEEEEVQLGLKADVGGDLVSSSALGTLSGPELNLRERHEYDGGTIGLGRRNYDDLLADKIDLDVGEASASSVKIEGAEEDAGLDLGNHVGRDVGRVGADGEAQRGDPSLDLGNGAGRILSFSSSTIGTENYKLWNKINAQLERVSQGRYGPIPKEIKRVRNGFFLVFRYADQTTQEIHWRNNGRVWIKVVGNSRYSDVQELRRALDSLLKLSLKY